MGLTSTFTWWLKKYCPYNLIYIYIIYLTEHKRNLTLYVSAGGDCCTAILSNKASHSLGMIPPSSEPGAPIIVYDFPEPATKRHRLLIEKGFQGDGFYNKVFKKKYNTV